MDVKQRSDVVRFEFGEDPSGSSQRSDVRTYYRVQRMDGGAQDRDTV